MNPLRAQFDALLDEYRRELPAKIAHMEALLAAGRTGELRRALHSLGGSAGTFGLPQVGDVARACEDCLVDNPDAVQRNKFGNVFAKLKKLGTAIASSG
jgi:HPt (histidine-containing phosphotransfer) domain-containing protein